MKTLQLSGSFQELGYQHGLLGKEEVLQSLNTYERLFFEFSQLSWKQARAVALQHLGSIEKYDGDLVEEMEGVSKGAGVDFEDILALNCRSEIALTGGEKGVSFSDGCTAIAVCPPLSSDVIIGQNWDWKGEQKKSLLLLKISQPNKPKITMITEGGIIGKIGMNEYGIGVCLNALLTDKSSREVPIHLGLRGVLNSESLHEAISRVKNGQMASAANFLIGHSEEDGDGLAFNVEVSSFGIEMEGNREGKVVHTNHICSPTLKEHLQDQNEFIYEDSMIRKSRAEQLVEIKAVAGQKVTEEHFKEWFSDTYNAPNSINSFENMSNPPHRRMETVFSVIMNLSKRRMWVCEGKPAEGQYVEIS